MEKINNPEMTDSFLNGVVEGILHQLKIEEVPENQRDFLAYSRLSQALIDMGSFSQLIKLGVEKLRVAGFVIPDNMIPLKETEDEQIERANLEVAEISERKRVRDNIAKLESQKEAQVKVREVEEQTELFQSLDKKI